MDEGLSGIWRPSYQFWPSGCSHANDKRADGNGAARVLKQMVIMGPVQWGLPLPSAIPRHWPIIIIDIKDCFFSIPLHSQDTVRFAVTVPSIVITVFQTFNAPFTRVVQDVEVWDTRDDGAMAHGDDGRASLGADDSVR